MKTLQVMIGLAVALALASGTIGYATEIETLDTEVQEAIQLFKHTDSKIGALFGRKFRFFGERFKHRQSSRV